MSLTRQGVVKAGNLTPALSKASSEQQTAIFLVDDFAPQPEQGKSFWSHNRLGGDRGPIGDESPPTNTKVYWGKGVVTATITGTSTGVGVWTALNHPIAEHNTIDFSAIFPPQIKTGFQGRVTGLGVKVVTGTGSFQVEFKGYDASLSQETTLWSQSMPLVGRPQNLSFDLPPTITEVQNINWLVTGSVGDLVVVDRVVLTATLPQLATEQQAFLWSYAMLLNNWDQDSGLTRDHAYYATNKFDNISASGMQAAAAVMAWRLGFISWDSATEIVTKTTEALLELPDCHGLWPHFTENVISGTEIISNAEIISGTEWSSIDTTIATIALLEAREALNLTGTETISVEQVLMGMYSSSLTSTLVLTNGSISHGYTTDTDACRQLRANGKKTGFCDCSQSLEPSGEGGWKDFGTESWLVNLGFAAATGNTAVFTHISPTYNGSGFIDELAWLLVPSPDIDRWGTRWNDYREQAAKCQLAYYKSDPTPGCKYFRDHLFYESERLFGLSAAEVPDLSAVPITQTYQPFGVGGMISPNDGTELLGYPVIVPHYAAMISSLRPTQAIALWEWIDTAGLFTPLNNVESFGCKDESKSTCEQVVWNGLKGSWNLSLQALGWGRLLTGDDNPLYQGMWSNHILGKGYMIMWNPAYRIFLPLIVR